MQTIGLSEHVCIDTLDAVKNRRGEADKQGRPLEVTTTEKYFLAECLCFPSNNKITNCGDYTGVALTWPWGEIYLRNLKRSLAELLTIS